MQDSQSRALMVVFDIDGVVRDVAGSYRRALADTVEQFTQGQHRPTMAEIDALKAEGCWNNDWKASEELVYRFYKAQNLERPTINYSALVDFFQGRYRGQDFSGYIQNEPLLMTRAYLEQLTQADIAWGFFSGATRGSAAYVLERRLELESPVLIAMEDAPGKPDPTGLMATVDTLREGQDSNLSLTVFYVGDTVADIQTAINARSQYPNINWIGVGVLPPHAQDSPEYAQKLREVGAIATLNNVQDLTPELMQSFEHG
ncbi:MAG: TIGR01548 family HAD-type hydrolase [Cyanobacteria bacterium P01_A01_bin.17]